LKYNSNIRFWLGTGSEGYQILLKYNSNIRFWLGTGSEGYQILKHSL
jgi:hypothetical protein